MTTNMTWGVLVLGGAGGWFVGRWWAERARAKFDQDRIWAARKNYRRGSKPPSPPPPSL